MFFIFTKYIDEDLKKKCEEFKALADQISQPDVNIEGIEAQVSKIYDEISQLEDKKTRITKRFLVLREHLSVKLSTVEFQLQECLLAKIYFHNFIYSNLNVVEISSYGLCDLLDILGVKFMGKEHEESNNQLWRLYFLPISLVGR